MRAPFLRRHSGAMAGAAAVLSITSAADTLIASAAAALAAAALLSPMPVAEGCTGESLDASAAVFAATVV